MSRCTWRGLRFSRRAPAIEPTLLTPKELRLAGGSVFSYVADPAQLKARAAQVIEGVQGGVAENRRWHALSA